MVVVVKVNTKFYKLKGMNDMRNKEIRNAMKQKGITQWKLGELLGVSENTVNRKLRKELPEEEKNYTAVRKAECKRR